MSPRRAPQITPAQPSDAVILEESPELAEALAWMQALTTQHGGKAVGAFAAEHLQTGGKYLRARLALAASSALQADKQAAVSWAAACELAHNATLVHDDLQDGDTHRRGQPTCWVRHGAAQAINVGDLLLMLPTLAVARVQNNSMPEAVRWRLCHLLAERMAAVIAGQGEEGILNASGNAEQQAYESMVAGKTSALFELPVAGAALSAGLSPQVATDLSRPFRELGVIFQMQDDLVDLVGDKGRDQVGSDLREGKISAVVVAHLARHPEDRAALFAVLETPREQTDQRDVLRMIALFSAKGTIDQVYTDIRARAERARNEVDTRLLPGWDTLMAQLLRPLRHLSSPA